MSDNGPFIDDKGVEYFVDNDGNRYQPPEVQLPMRYSCEHGASNTPDECHLRAWALTTPPGTPVPAAVADDWHLDAATAPVVQAVSCPNCGHSFASAPMMTDTAGFNAAP